MSSFPLLLLIAATVVADQARADLMVIPTGLGGA
jgi:folylpolyglutamate synthase/dihydropteroate synthase